MKLALYTDPLLLATYRREAGILKPLLPGCRSPSSKNKSEHWTKSFPKASALDAYYEAGKEYFKLSSLEECDLAILPFDWCALRSRNAAWLATTDSEGIRSSRTFAQQANRLGKPAAVFFTGDRSHEHVPVPGAFVFRHSAYASKRSLRDFVMPTFVENFTEIYFSNQVPLRQKRQKPTIGFCGIANKYSAKTHLKSLAYQAFMLSKFGCMDSTPYEGARLRWQAIDVLRESSLVTSNFKLYDKHVLFRKDTTNEERHAERKVYVQNMLDSDYILCSKGSSNYSYRLYETLSSGRIPVLINTDIVLPFDFTVNWKDYCVWVEKSELPWIDEKLADFHSEISNDDFVELQRACYDFWLNWLSAAGFFRNFWRHFNFSSARSRQQLSEIQRAVGEQEQTSAYAL